MSSAFDRAWNRECVLARATVILNQHLDRGVSHNLLASMRAFQVLVGRMPTEPEVLKGADFLRLLAQRLAEDVA